MPIFTGLRTGGAGIEATFSSQKCLAPCERRLARHCWGNYLVWSIRGTQFWVQCFLLTVFYIPLLFVVTECLRWELFQWIYRSTKTFSQTVSLCSQDCLGFGLGIQILRVQHLCRLFAQPDLGWLPRSSKHTVTLGTRRHGVICHRFCQCSGHNILFFLVQWMLVFY